jgi:hypothetical protein
MPGTRIPNRKDVEAVHARRFAYMSMLKTRFTLPHMVGLYRHFGGDMALPIVLGEIAIRNLQAVFQMRADEPYDVLDLETERRIVERKYTTEHLRPANALSIAQATGIPRETVRRKVEKLIEKGWVQRDERGHLFVTRKAGEDLGEFDREETVRFSLAAGAVLKVLEGEFDEAK